MHTTSRTYKVQWRHFCLMEEGQFFGWLWIFISAQNLWDGSKVRSLRGRIPKLSYCVQNKD